MSSTEMYFVAATTVTRWPICFSIVPKRSRIASGDSGDHSLAPRDAAVAPVREEELGMAERAEVGALDFDDACLVQRELDGAPEVRPGARRRPSPPCPPGGRASRRRGRRAPAATHLPARWPPEGSRR